MWYSSTLDFSIHIKGATMEVMKQQCLFWARRSAQSCFRTAYFIASERKRSDVAYSIFVPAQSLMVVVASSVFWKRLSPKQDNSNNGKKSEGNPNQQTPFSITFCCARAHREQHRWDIWSKLQQQALLDRLNRGKVCDFSPSLWLSKGMCV